MHGVRKLLEGRAGPIALALVLGAANAVLLAGWGPINPRNTGWLFGDTATYYSGWEQYRHDTHLHFPLPWTERLGYPVGTSIAMLDAIPLAAVVLRPLSPILPEPFQYLGLWATLCFVLQAYFGFSLCRRLFPSDAAFQVLGGLFFLLAAPLTFRAFGHIGLMSQWLVLAALDSYFCDPGERPVRWLCRMWIVLALGAAITPYIAAMCFVVALGCVGRLVIEFRCGWWRAAYLTAATVAVVAASAATMGVLVASDSGSYWADGYGRFSLNLNAPFNPMAMGSILLPALPLSHPEQADGYGYLGLGMITLLVVNLARRPRSVTWIADRRVLALVPVAVVCTALAASTSMTFGAHTLLTIPLPHWIQRVLQGLRASGRLFWPAYYLIYLAALSLTFWLWKAPYRTAILAAALALQIADAVPLRASVRAASARRFENLLKSPAWIGLGRMVDNVILVPPFQCGPEEGAGGIYSYVYYGKLAALERLRLNSYYAARYTRPELWAHCVDLLRTQLAGTLDERSAYLVSPGVRTVWALSGMRSHSCQEADGAYLCTPVSLSEAPTPPAAPPAAPPYALDDVLDFTRPDGNARRYVTFGWRGADPTGTWSEGPLAMVRLGLDAAVDRTQPLVLDIDAAPFLAPRHPRLDVDVLVNGERVSQWTYVMGSINPHQQAQIPAVIAARRGGVDVEFRFRDPEAPAYVDVNPFHGFLALQVRSLVVHGVKKNRVE